MNKEHGPVLLFDGVCNLCVGSVQFFLKHDRKNTLKFASLQSDFGVRSRQKYNILPTIDSLLLIKNDKVYNRSTAALLACAELGGIWPIILVLRIIPKFIRDYIYDYIARNRYKWFGKKEVCWIPTPELNTRFIK